jgi:hypothetical protein
MAAETRNPEPITYSFVPRSAMNRIAGLGRISESAVRTCRHPPGRPPRYASESIRHSFDAIQSRRQTTVVCAISNERNKLWQSGYKRKTWSVLLQLINKIKAERNPTLLPPAPALRPARFANLEIIYLAAGFYGRNQPARLLPAARPCFGRRLRIAIFRKNPRVFTSGLTIRVVGLRSIPALDDAPATIEDRQTLFKLTLFRRDPSSLSDLTHYLDNG